MQKSLKVRASGTALIQNIAAMNAGISRYVGRTWNAALNGFVANEQAETVPFEVEYYNAIRNGDLLPADEETAKFCQVTFVK